ncbi:hypothetical protein BS47DRAFT_1305586 [Hydnum rufescens UP504]|uniref:Cytochrome P450 n=1 Tax=Hydnum rufescens UP504 TaxID=1448309 RepID=A0A9P6AIY6_9AGAM|nr:hypothetical protein BS47DRAFT_1305586 [Hydnum rufescens UP504]
MFGDYRLEFVADICRILIPSLLLGRGLVALLSPIALPQTLLYLAALVAVITSRIQLVRLYQRRDAARRGAVFAPEVKGRWPGNLDLFLEFGQSFYKDYLLEFQDSLFDELQSDTINARLLWRDLIITRDHNVVKTVLATGFPDFEKGPKTKMRLFSLFGNGIFNSDGEQWKAHRALTRPFFARERVRDFEHFDHYSNKVIDLFRARALSGESIDVQDVFGRFTLDAAGGFLFGTKKLNTLDDPLPEPGKAALGPKGSLTAGDYGDFVNAFEQIQSLVARRTRRIWLWPLYEFFGDSTTPYNKTIDEWVCAFLCRAPDRRALEAKKQRGDKKMDADDGSLIDHLADSTSNVTLIREEVCIFRWSRRKSQLITAALLTFTLYLLSQHPEVTQKLRAEIIEVVPEGAPTFDHVRGMRYWEASVRPSVLPSAPGCKPIYMPGPGVNLMYFDFLIQRRKDLWGADADEFSPERWIDPERLKIMTSDPFKFIPFNAGPRICLGQNFAYNEASFIMVRILQVFDGFELRQDDAPAGSTPPASWKHRGGRASIEKAWPLSAVTLYSKGGMWIRMHPANN